MVNPQPNAQPEQGAGAPAQPEAPATAPAAQPQEQVSTSQPAQADDTAAWLQSKGIDPSSPEALQKLTQMAYNSEKQMTKATQEASELRKSLTPVNQPPSNENNGTDPMMTEFIQDYRRDKQISNFKTSHTDWQEHEPAMVNLLNEVVNTPYGQASRSQLVNAGFLSLEDVYTMAKGSAPIDTTAIQTQAKQEVLQTLANTQRAGGGTSHASNSNPQAPANDPILEGIRQSRGQ